MFAPPPRIEAQVFARLGDALHRPPGRAPWLELQRPGAPMTSFIEGPAFDRAGNLWITDIPWGRIFRIDAQGRIALAAQYDGEPNGLAFHRDGRLIIADHKQGLMVMDSADGSVKPFCDRPRGERFKGVNDLVFARNGDLYFTDQGQSGLHDPSGRLYRLRADGRLECLLERIPSPNGLVLTPSENALLLAVTRDNAVWRVPLLPDGSVTKVGVFIRLSGGFGPDGLAIDAEGNLIVCHLGLGAVWVFDPRGEPLRRIQATEGSLTTNAAFGGPDGKSLFITESETGTVLRAELDTRGPMLFSHA